MDGKKLRHTILFGTVLLGSIIYVVLGGAVIADFHAESSLNRVDLKWVVTAETQMKGYRIMRSLDGIQYQKLAFIPAVGVNGREYTYRFSDNSVFKSTGRTFYYKLELVNLDDTFTEYEKVVVVSPQISSARHTWGSLKAMFR